MDEKVKTATDFLKNNEINCNDLFKYQLLGRMQNDCIVYLGDTPQCHNPNRLWAMNEQKQIEIMKNLYLSFPDDKKPQWISMKDIVSYEDKILNITKDHIISNFFKERTGFTENPLEAIFMLRDGQLVSGGYDCGIRGEDHCIAEGLSNSNRNESDFWSRLHYETDFIRLVPETRIALIMEGQILNSLQDSLIHKIGYKVEEYCPTYETKKTSIDFKDKPLSERIATAKNNIKNNHHTKQTSKDVDKQR